MTTFKFLLLREWMQHRRGWLILALAPAVFMLIGMLIGNVNVNSDERPTGVLLVIAGGYTLVLTFLGWMAVGFQAAGVARRDQQDRSIEFWRSLPVSDVQAVGATVLHQLLLMPMLVLAIALACSLPVGLLAMLRGFGWQSLGQIDGLWLISTWGLGALRMGVGVCLAAFWAAPLLLLLMAASAWFKRWGVLLVGLLLLLAGPVLAFGGGRPQLQLLMQAIGQRFIWALAPINRMSEAPDLIQTTQGQPSAAIPDFLLYDLGQVLRDVLHPSALLALAVAAASFAALVWRRQRG